MNDNAIWGEYQLQEELGRGGMGVVYLADHSRFGQVALKILKPNPTAYALQSLRNEIDTLITLDHPGIVRVYEHGLRGHLPWMAMEFFSGRLLSHRLHPEHITQNVFTRSYKSPLVAGMTLEPEVEPHRGDPTVLGDVQGEKGDFRRAAFSREVGLRWMHQVCQALVYIHSKGVLHTDVKPDNILITEKGQAVLVDFGLARPYGSRLEQGALEHAGLRAGSLDYMSPEQLAGYELDARTDLYAVGCILFELMVRNSSLSFHKVQVSPRAVSSPSLKNLGLDIPEPLDQLIQGLLSHDPLKRPGQAQVILRVLESIGIGEPVHLTTSQPEAGRPLLGKAQLVGRSGLMEQLDEQLAACVEGESRVLMLVGEGGAGKSRIAFELLRTARVRFGAQVLLGYGTAIHSQPLGMLVPILRKVADVCLQWGQSTTMGIFAHEDAGAVLAPYAPFLREVPGIWADVPLAPLPLEAARLRLDEALVGVLDRFCQGGLVCLMLDDLQWVDELTFGFLQHTTARIKSRSGWMVVGTCRSDEAGDALRRLVKRCKVFEVERLDQNDVEQMMAQMLGPATDPLVVKAIAQKSSGNPFFVVEHLQMLVEQGILRLDHKGWVIAQERLKGKLGELPTPGSIDVLISDRLKRLKPNSRHICEAAAVLGRRFDKEMLEQVAQTSGPQLDDALKVLSERHIFESDGHQLSFVHNILQETTLAKVESKALVQMHHRAARALESRGNPGDMGVIARHWSRADKPLPARECFIDAARFSKKNQANNEARGYYRAGLDLFEPGDFQALETRVEFADFLAVSFNACSQSVEQAQIALDLLKNTSEEHTHLKARAHVVLGQALIGLNLADEACEHLERGAELASQVGAHRTWGKALSAVGLAATGRDNWGLDRQPAQQAYYEKALELFEVAGVVRERAITLSNMGLGQEEVGLCEEALSSYARALDIANASGDLGTAGMVWNNMSCVYGRLHQLHREQHCLRQAIEKLTAIDSHYFRCVVQYNLGNSMMACCDYNASIALHKQSINILEEESLSQAYRLSTKIIASSIAKALACLGQFENARALLTEAGTLLEQEENPWPTTVEKVYRMQAFTAMLYGDLDEMVTLLDKRAQLILTTHTNIKRSRGMIVRMSAYVHRCRGELQRAETLCRDALEATEDYIGAQAQRLQNELGRVLLEQGRLDEARAIFTNVLGVLVEPEQYQDARATTQLYMAKLHRFEGTLESARHQADEALRCFRDIDHKVGIALALCERARCALPAQTHVWLEQLDCELESLSLHPDSEILREQAQLLGDVDG